MHAMPREGASTMKPKRAASPLPELEATVSELSPGGDGVAIVPFGGERRALFVRGVVPGDRIRVAIDASSRPSNRARRAFLRHAGSQRRAAGATGCT
jgi:hypothetical protein